MIGQFIEQCLQAGIEFSLGNGGKLKISADKKALTPALTASIKSRKLEILEYLRGQEIQQLDADFQAQVGSRNEILQRLNLREQDIDGFYPLVPLQESILLEHMLNEQNDPYITYFILKVDSQQVLDKVLSSYQSVIDRHASCRTAIVWRGVDRALQLVKKRVDIPVTYINCYNEEEQKEKLTYLKNSERVMDLELDPLTRIHVLVRQDSEERLVFIERHHIVGDHISLEITLMELLQFYQGQEESLEPVRQQYELALQLNQQGTPDSRYFDDLVDDFESPSLLGNIRKAHVDSRDVHELTHRFVPGLEQNIRRHAQILGVSPAVMFHFAWGLVMAQYCGSRDVLFPTVFTGRMINPEYRTTIGMFLNSLPFRLRLTDASVAQQLKDVNLQLLQTSAREQVPFNQAIQKLTNQLGIAFNCIFNFRHSRDAEVMEALPFEHLVSKTESTAAVVLNVTDFGRYFEAELNCYKDINGDHLIESLVLALQYVVAAIDPEVSDIEAKFFMPQLLSQQQQQLLLNEFNDTALSPQTSGDLCVHQVIERQAAANPDAIAVLIEGRQLSYKALNEKANQLARHIRSHYEIQPDTLVGLCVGRSIEMVIGILAILKSGGAYVPLDPDYPQERLAFMLQDANVQLLLSSSQLTDSLPPFDGNLLYLDELPNTVAEQSRSDLLLANSQLSSSDLAYVIYTSGSTGTPKGVMVEHGNLLDYMLGAEQKYFETHVSGSLIFNSLSFDLSLPCLYLPLMHGLTVEMIGEQWIGSARIAEVLLQNSPKLLRLTPSHLLLLTDQLEGQVCETVHVFVVGGEVLDPQLAGRLVSIFPNVKLYNHYGPSECTIGCTAFPVSKSYLQSGDPIPVGKPLANTEVFVCATQEQEGSNLQLAPLGAIGELYVGGLGITRGYLNRDNLTAERFVTNPFYDANKHHSSKRLYRTGDLARFDNDGNLQFVGRADDQVKIRGFRVELGEIENQLAAIHNVDSAAVKVWQQVEGAQLVGYLKPAAALTDESTPEFIKAARTRLQRRLPDYMVPDVLMTVEQWPLTPNGKILRKALPEPKLILSRTEFEAAQTQTEHTIVHHIAEMLKLDKADLSIAETLLNLGFNSILSLRLSQKLSAQFGIDAPLTLILEANSIKELAMELDLILSVNSASDVADAVEEEW